MYNTNYPFGNYPMPQQTYNNFNVNQRMEVVKVNGQNGAQAYQMPPNSSALLLDETAPLVWLVQTDGAGYKTTTPYNITPYQQEPAPDFKQLEERIAKLEGIINAKSDSVTA